MLRKTDFGYYINNKFQTQILANPSSVNLLANIAMGNIEGGSAFSASENYVYDVSVIPFDLTKQCQYYGTAITVNNADLFGTNSHHIDPTKDVRLYPNFWINSYYNLGEYYVKYPENFHGFGGFSKLRAFLPYYGWIELPLNELIGKYIQFRLYIDISTCTGTYYIGRSSFQKFGTKDDDDIDLIATYNCTLGYQMAITRTNKKDTIRNMLLTASTAVATLAGQTYLNYLPTESTTIKTYKKINPDTNRFKTVLKTQEKYKPSKYNTEKHKIESYSSVLNQSSTCVFNSTIKAQADKTNNVSLNNNITQNIIIEITKPKIIEVNNEQYSHLFGKPSGFINTLKYVHGFTKITNCHLENKNFNSVFEEEKNDILEYMVNGIILP